MSKETYAFCSWFGSGPVCIQTISEPHQSPFGSGPRPPQKVGLVRLFGPDQGSLECIHTCAKGPDQGGKRTVVRLKRTKSGKGEYTLRFFKVATLCSNNCFALLAFPP
ncbi:hypothetical protein ATANTOWER_005026 [Ataeniobius toweri]|uniref:Uncharacterized protein n=1 Tax=Ataeniobius toweri TaxID=208326 RepID=A0ABU7BMS6_9TELE|nr:hypothetical protein [Ataeniobius toweri]